MHAPRPSHFPTVVAVVALQLFAPHDVPAIGGAHAARSEPLHASTPHVGSALAVPHFARPTTGAAPAGVGTQVPTEPATSHASHWLVHAALQHTPSATRLDVHADALVAACPLFSVHAPGCEPLHVPVGAHVLLVQQTPSVHDSPDLHCGVEVHGAPAPSNATHDPALQKKPAAQSVATLQLVLHAVPEQAKTPHDLAVAYAQSPAPLQPAASYSTPPEQIDAPVHAFVEAG